MTNGNTERKIRSVATTFNLKDVAVVAIAAFTAAGPFFAYDTRISVVETKVDQITTSDAETKEHVKEIAGDLKQHNKEVEDLKQQLKAFIESELAESQHAQK